jgi:uncharacterized protein
VRFLDTSRIRTRFDERVRVADGVELSVDLYLPPQPGWYPALLTRTPASNNRGGRAGVSSAPAERWKAFAAQGYIVAAADVRGRGDSDGKFAPFIHEADDGAATIEWLREFNECSGRIGVFGSGYGAFCAWAAAARDGHVDAIASISPFGAVGEGLVHRGGAVRLDWLFWMHLIGGRTVQPANVPPWQNIHRHLPLNTLDEALGREDIWWREWMEHLDPADPFWNPLDLAEKIAQLEAPGLHVTGWWDGQIAAARYYYEAASRSGAPQWLIIGPWDTAGVRHAAARVGGFDFGPRSLIDLNETLEGFFDATLRKRETRHTDMETRAQSRVFVTGRNEWVSCDDWSPEPTSTLVLYLDSLVGANTRRGDGTLAKAPSSGDRADVITHNPAVPVDFQPQFASFAAGANPLGFTLDQSHVTSRDEALVYTSGSLDYPVSVFGRPLVTFTVRTTAPDADLYVSLSDCFPMEVRDLHLCHAVTRLAMHRSFTPGGSLKVTLLLETIAHDFLPGHQIRLTITPSLFPLYARNLHRCNYASAYEPAIANIELLHGPGEPASLMLPLAGAPS